MGAGALLALQLAPVVIDLLKSGQLQGVIAKVAPHLSSLLKDGKLSGIFGTLGGGDGSDLIKTIGSSLEGAGAPDKQIVLALSTLAELMPNGAGAEQYRSSIDTILNGVQGLKDSLSKAAKAKE